MDTKDPQYQKRDAVQRAADRAARAARRSMKAPASVPSVSSVAPPASPRPSPAEWATNSSAPVAPKAKK